MLLQRDRHVSHSLIHFKFAVRGRKVLIAVVNESTLFILVVWHFRFSADVSYEEIRKIRHIQRFFTLVLWSMRNLDCDLKYIREKSRNDIESTWDLRNTFREIWKFMKWGKCQIPKKKFLPTLEWTFFLFLTQNVQNWREKLNVIFLLSQGLENAREWVGVFVMEMRRLRSNNERVRSF